MRDNTILLGVILLAILASCNNNTREQQYVPLNDVIRQQPVNRVVSGSPLFNTTVNVPGKADSVNRQQAPASLSSIPAVTSTTALNPPHGQPGHRCDIPVGAPLNSAPPETSTAVSSSIGAVNGQKLNATNGIAAGINPPHGQPGHRCDIAVGAPLNSKPLPVTQKNAVTTVTPKGMNPPHGQPGHRCDIAVGAPLNSKPVVTPAIVSNKAEPIAPATNCVTGTELPADGLNPEHGKPGHRCDINVGTALSSKPAPSLSDRLNPPHGQNGHRCDIAVGAYVDSPKPGTIKDSTNS